VKANRYAEMKRDRPRPHIVADAGPTSITVRCRVGRSRKFSLLDRLRFLFTGRMFVVTINGKEHTEVVLALRPPTEHERKSASQKGIDG
jgi:hypothetical protein